MGRPSGRLRPFRIGLSRAACQPLHPTQRGFLEHGLKPDGAMEAFGATHMMIDSILAPKIEALAGRDPENPKPFEPREPKVVGKIKKSRPTTILSSFQDDESLPSKADHFAATELLSAIGEDVAFETQARAREPADKSAEVKPPVTNSDAIAPLEGEAAGIIAGGGGQDVLNGGAGADRLAGEKGEAPAESSGLEERVRLAERLAGSRARAWRNAASGRESQEKLARRMLQARQELAEAYAASGLNPADAADAADTYLAEAAPDDLGRLAVELAGLTPLVGEAMSLIEAAGLDVELDEAIAAGNDKRAGELRNAMAAALFGAVPFAGKFERVGRIADRVTDRIRPLRQQKARRQLQRAWQRWDEDIDGLSARKALGEDVWASLTPAQRRSLNGIVNNRKGAAGERLLKNWLDQADLHAPLKQKKTLRRYVADAKDGAKVVRHLDEVTTQHFVSTFGGLWLRKKDGAKGWEVKTDGAQLSGNQKDFEELTTKGSKISPHPPKGAPVDLPDIDPQIENLRVPLGEVDELHFRKEVRERLKAKDYSDDLVEQMDQGIATFFAHYRAAKHRDDAAFAANFTISSVLIAIAASLPTEEGD